jgi:Ferritin-like
LVLEKKINEDLLVMQNLRNTIIELMSVPEEKCDLDWLKKSLQAAIKLEFSTIPPYLCALWSIRDEDANGAAAESIRNQISLEEMLHFAIACNLLVALGETPKLNQPDSVPTYPGPLPGLDNPDLIVSLRGLSPSALQVFLQVEYPEFTPLATLSQRPISTIGAFYTRILKEFEAIDSAGELTLLKDRQIDMTTTFFFDKSYVVENLEDVKKTIETIQRQGEGSSTSPEDQIKNSNTSEEIVTTDLAHYYRFAEIFEGQRLVKNKVTKKWDFSGEQIIFPKVFPMAKVPSGGYQEAQVSKEIWDTLLDFDRKFTEMMNQLQKAWSTDSASLNEAIKIMRTLRQPAQKLMDTPIISDKTTGTYGPCFRLIS